MSDELSYCARVVRDHDPDRFFVCMLMRSDVREALFALFAFNYEIAKTREVVTETQLGLIRLQWWREAIDKIYTDGAIESEKTIEALARVIADYGLEKDDFDQLIYAREFDLEDVLPASMDGLVKYAEFTSAPLMKMVCKVVDSDYDADVSVNYALVGIVRAVRFHAAQRRCYLPQDLINQHGVKLNQLYDGKPQDGLPAVIKAVAAQVKTDVAPRCKFTKLLQKASMMHLAHLKSCDYDIFHPRAILPPPFKALRLFWVSLFA